MIVQNPIVEDERQSLEISEVIQKSQNKDRKRDFNVVKMERIMKLQQILSKNLKLREASISNKQKQGYPVVNRIKANQKMILPLINRSEQYEQQKDDENIHKNNCRFSQEINKANQLLKKYREKQVSKKERPLGLISNEPGSRIMEENPQAEEKLQEQRSILKLKVRNLQLQQFSKDLGQHHMKKLKSSMSNYSIGASKQSIGASKPSIERIGSIQKLILKNRQGQTQKQQKKDFRRKRRNASTLNLSKIQHLPQIVFPTNKKCTKQKFPTMSMAQIDNNLLTHEIFQLEEKRAIEVKSREKRQKMLKRKIKAHQKSHFLQSICQ